MSPQYDAIVLGLGGIGSGAAYWLSRRGARVLGIEQFELGHERGESHDHSRIIRLSYHAAHYVRLAKEAYAAWSALEEDARERLVYKTGGLDIGPCDGAISIDDYASALNECGVPFERLDADAIRRRFPAFTIGDGVHGLFQSESGIVAAERATRAHQHAARRHGAVLMDRTRITAVRDRDGEIEVATDDARFSARSLVVAAGPWTARVLAHFDMRLPLEVTKEQALYFTARTPAAFARGSFPIWIWMDDPSFYGFPIFAEAGAVKVTQDAGGKPVDPDTRTFEPDPAITARVQAFLARYLPGALGPVSRIKTCLYTLPPDRDFIVDTLSGHPRVHVAVGAGHAFKFASVIGRILTELAIDGRTTSDISHFAIGREVLRMESPPKTYMV